MKNKAKPKLHGEIVFEKENIIPFSLDLKDKKILAILATNSRTPLTTIGKLVGLSQENVLYRIKKLQEQNIIVDFFTAIDSRKLDILVFVVFIKFSKISKEKQEALIESFLKNDHISWITTTAGQFDMMIFMQAMDVYEFEKEWQKVLKEHGQTFSATDIGIMTEYGHCPAYYPVADIINTEIKNTNHFPYKKEFTTAKGDTDLQLDRNDLKIIQELLPNSRIKLTMLGQKIGMSSQNVDLRIRHLISSGIIKSFGYRPNYQKLQYQYYTVRLKLGAVDIHKKESLKAFVLSLPQIFYYFSMIGHWTYSFHLFYKDVRELNDFLTLLRDKFGDIIEEYDSTIHLDQYYYTYIARSSYKYLYRRYS